MRRSGLDGVSTQAGVQYQARSVVLAPGRTPVIFSVKAGETVYIGDFYANALTFCLSNVNNAETTVAVFDAQAIEFGIESVSRRVQSSQQRGGRLGQ